MDPFDVHGRLVADYSAFTSGFTSVRDERMRDHVGARMAAGDQWPDPVVSLNPNFASCAGWTRARSGSPWRRRVDGFEGRVPFALPTGEGAT